MKILLVAAAILSVLISSAYGQEASRRVDSRVVFSPEQILLNMPVNSDRRCVGISLVAAALLEGECIANGACDVPRELANQIYDGAISKQQVRFPEILCLGDGRVAIQSREGLDALATAVMDRYKALYQEMIASDAGRRRLRSAERLVIRTPRELDSILDTDRDKIVAFPLVGIREFPSGEKKDTNHAVLIAKRQNGEKVVYDPNDPGRAQKCELSEMRDGLEIGWTCRYRDTGLITTQHYLLLHPDKAFRLILTAD
jgi:hypothetical protein